MLKRKIGRIIIIGLAIAICLLLLFHHNPLANKSEELIKKIIGISIDLLAMIILLIKYDTILQLIKELFQNRRLIWKLSKNDFKTKYAGSYLGTVWAFIQPIVTILIYYVVFQILFPAKATALGGVSELPFILYLTAGLVPWLYFTEALVSGMGAFREYNYLVKKVVFKISILPIIKVIGATFVHVFFVVFILILNVCMGNYPSIYWIQLIYFSLCLFIFTLALCYALSSMVVFFKDLSQIVSIILQVGIWATPIMWKLIDIPEQYHIFIKINPVFYIVNGYRSAMYESTWFWQDFYSTMYFWIVTAALFALGVMIFKRLKPHFADVL